MLAKTKVKSDRLGHLLKLPIFVVQKAAGPESDVEFRKKSIGAIRFSPVTSGDVALLLTNPKFGMLVVGGSYTKFSVQLCQ